MIIVHPLKIFAITIFTIVLLFFIVVLLSVLCIDPNIYIFYSDNLLYVNPNSYALIDTQDILSNSDSPLYGVGELPDNEDLSDLEVEN